MFCNNCGSENRNDRKYCANCGSPLKDYTKPRENLIMPEDINKKQIIVNKRNKLRIITNFIMMLFLVLGTGFSIASFYVESNLVQPFAVIGIICIVLTIITYIVKRKMINNYDKAFKE